MGASGVSWSDFEQEVLNFVRDLRARGSFELEAVLGGDGRFEGAASGRGGSTSSGRSCEQRRFLGGVLRSERFQEK